MNKSIVVHDPSGNFWEGAVIPSKDGPDLAEAGGCSLPCVVEDFVVAGFAGYAKRAWGSGYALPEFQPQHFAPIAIYKTRPGPMRVHWAARLVPSSEAFDQHVRAGGKLEGQLRLASQPGRGNVFFATMGEVPAHRMALELADLSPIDANGGWNVTGSGSFSSGPEGLYGLSLYGCGRGVRVAWLAVSLTP